MKILYLHGIGSGADSRTPRELRKDFPDITIDAPELPARPREAYEFLKKNYWNAEYDLVIGTSLGGFYAMTFPLGKRILVNPAMYADKDIKDGIGYGSQQFFAARSDGATEYTIDEEFIGELAEIRKNIYGNRDMMYPNKLDINLINATYAVFGDNDTLLHHYNDFCKWCIEDHAIRCNAEHRLSTEEIHDVLTPFVKKVCQMQSDNQFTGRKRDK